MRLLVIVTVTAATGIAAADPSPPPAAPGPFVLPALSLFDAPTPLVVPSLRLEAARIAAARTESDWRYPEPGALVGLDGEGWFVGAGFYRPLTARSAALHAGSIGTTILGEILLASGSPLAGVGALAAGATLDAAAADVDRAAEAPRR